MINKLTAFFKNSKLNPKFNRKVYNELSAMSQRELRDIGIVRNDIINVALGKKTRELTE